MTDLFERRLAERLQAHPLPEEIPDLGIRSVRLGERMRRRQIGAVVAALVLLLIIPVAVGLWRVAAGTREPPTVTSPTSTPQTSAGPKLVVLQYRYRSLGAPPEVGTIRGRTVRLASGKTVRLPADQFGSITEYGSGLAWLTRSGGEFRLNVSPQRLPISTNGGEVTGAEPGPDGSVMVRTKAGPVLFTRAGMLLAPSKPQLRTNRMVATANDIWVDNGGRVMRVGMADLASGSFVAQAYPQWRKVIIGDTRADRVVVIDDHGCQAVVNGSTAASVWRSCDWELSAFSPDGRFVAGRSVRYGTIGIIDLNAGELALGIEEGPAQVGSHVVFDQAGRLNLRMGDPAHRFDVVVCSLAGEWWHSTTRSADPIAFVLPNRK
jgi:hypothetical protein